MMTSSFFCLEKTLENILISKISKKEYKTDQELNSLEKLFLDIHPEYFTSFSNEGINLSILEKFLLISEKLNIEDHLVLKTLKLNKNNILTIRKELKIKVLEKIKSL